MIDDMITVSTLPHVIEVNVGDLDSFRDYFLTHQKEIDEQLKVYGALKLANVPIDSRADFNSLVNSISEQFLSYIDGNSPRTKLSDNVYTSTEYDASQKITMHNELSYSASWPRKLYFTCLTVPEVGGETLLADGREVYARLPQDIIEAVESKGVRYIRNLHGGVGMGPSWQHTFETEDPAEVEQHCRNLDIAFTWREDGTLHLEQYRQGVLAHHSSGEKVWFNQIDQFHPSHLGNELYQEIQFLFADPNEYPTYVTFGDHQPIPDEMIRKVIEVIDSVTIAPQWGPGELLIIDNEMVSHGRNSFTGPREVLVSMSK